jgi:hypothetical protein
VDESRQGEPGLLAPGQDADALVGVVAGEQERAEYPPHLAFGEMRLGAGQKWPRTVSARFFSRAE